MKGKYKRTSSWCDNCDKDIVAGGKKCGVCGVRASGIKLKQPSTDKIIKENDLLS